ncbi:Uncharacterized protein dnm_011750 [Desulfonema magnum]|uniref:Uncharacterized protein n=1 Tax=Desulfonema magnum TaxID=45655 RepID=A0A975GL38_9BACT|nr:Uncharacterized protein dnm_011750 [Desulfonema magnum]
MTTVADPNRLLLQECRDLIFWQRLSDFFPKQFDSRDF